MSYHKFKDSAGREFEGNIYLDFRGSATCDPIYAIEDAHYLDGAEESVSSDELDVIYNEIGWENNYR